MDEIKEASLSRRDLLQRGALIILLGVIPGLGVGRVAAAAGPKAAGGPQAGPEETPEVSPVEDLMREHGVLRRTLLIYEEVLKLLGAGKELPPGIISGAAGIIHNFIESYHEKLEEDYLFPRFEKAGKLVELVTVLRQQHQAGRRVTGEILKFGGPGELKTAAARGKLADSLRLFMRMYRPHAAREDTVLFPAFRSLVSPQEYDALGEDFERRENELFGAAGGFEGMVVKVAALEKQLGIYDLAQFTPKI